MSSADFVEEEQDEEQEMEDEARMEQEVESEEEELTRVGSCWRPYSSMIR
jgi:hypothetical protein